MRFWTTFEPYAFALLRIVAGFLFLFHGLQKLFGLFGGRIVAPVSQLGLAGAIEVAGGLLVMLGVGTRPAAFVCSGLMAAAYFQSHQPRALLPVQNGGELAAIYAFVFLYISTRGAGPLSLGR